MSKPIKNADYAAGQAAGLPHQVTEELTSLAERVRAGDSAATTIGRAVTELMNWAGRFPARAEAANRLRPRVTEHYNAARRAADRIRQIMQEVQRTMGEDAVTEARRLTDRILTRSTAADPTAVADIVRRTMAELSPTEQT